MPSGTMPYTTRRRWLSSCLVALFQRTKGFSALLSLLFLFIAQCTKPGMAERQQRGEVVCELQDESGERAG